jgi:Holliday junction resolvase
MEFEEVWRKVVQINPSLKPGAKVEITEENLRKIVHFAHRKGAESVTPPQVGTKEAWIFEALFGR